MTFQSFIIRILPLALGLFFMVYGPSVFSAQPQGPAPLDDLPLHVVPAQSSSGNTLAVMLSGDGGWAAIDKHIATGLARNGIPVVGLSSLAYFWTPRTPDSAAGDLDRIIGHYLTVWR